MKIVKALLLIACVGIASSAMAATTTSSFDNFLYSYTVTPVAGEDLRSFHIYGPGFECDPSHYYDLVMPDGWMFDTVEINGDCQLTFWTTGDPLPADVPTNFGYTHYCVPCCHSWFVSDEGSDNPLATPVDEDANHTEPCNIPAEYSDQCGGPGLILGPSYPVSVDADEPTWGAMKRIFR